MSPFESVGGRLAAGLLAVVVGVLVIVYVIVVPAYRTSVQNAELRTLGSELHTELPGYPTDPFSPYVDQWASSMAERHSVRTVVFTYTAIPPSVAPFADSNQTTNDSSLVNDPIALKAMTQRAPARGVVVHDGKHYAEVAYPLSQQGPAVMFASPLDEQLETVSVVRRRVIIAGGLAVAFAVLLGYLGASLFAQRIRRLEASVEAIAAGNFDEPVVDTGTDELGQLARAFERMRLRLATLDRARGEFIANASHELRTPLFSLGGFLELLDDPDLDPATRKEFVTQMREQVDRLTKLATDLLDLSRLDAGRLTVTRESIDLSELSDELAAEFQARARASDHPLELRSSAVVPARGDAERVLQIGRVLAENALVHTPPGTRVRLETGLDGGRATLTVADDGPGIPPDARQQVFQRFYRLAGARASGSGLGLAIARELAEVLDGRLELDERDGWTRFTLVLSADREAPVEERENAPSPVVEPNLR
jgi:signal transduction histidine kinase